MARGGARPGAGKPKGTKAAHTLESQELKKALIASYAAKATEINQALLDKALTGDVPAIKEIYDRVFGKAPQALTGENGGAIQVIQQIVGMKISNGNRISDKQP